MRLAVEGRVIAARKVGMGVLHETAKLEIEFNRIVLPTGEALPIYALVESVDNAREAVKNGMIHGIRSTETPQGEISSRLKYLPSLHLYPDPFLLSFKLLFPVFPEPEIYLPAGTDLRVELKDEVALPEGLYPPADVERLSKADEKPVVEAFESLPTRTLDKKGREADVINVAFLGDEDQVRGAFLGAGWKPSDRVSKHSVKRQFQAFLAQTNYGTAPMSRQLYDGRPPELTLEKTFDSYGRRDHLRIWKTETADGRSLWVGAAVHETGATLSVRRMGFMHHVSDDLEEEQATIRRDLLAAECVESAGLVARPDMEKAVINATGEVLRTDGDVMVLRLKGCGAPVGAAAPPFRPGSKFSRYLRKEILTVHSDLVRANCIYAVYQVTAATAKSLRHMSARRAEVKAVESQAANASRAKAPDGSVAGGLERSACSENAR